MTYSFSDNSPDLFAREFGLVYSPKNQVFDFLLGNASKGLGFAGVYGVNSSEKVEEMMIERDFFAGVVFKHAAVINYEMLHILGTFIK